MGPPVCEKGDLMDKNDIIEFFDKMASGWDADLVRDDAVIGLILDNALVTQGKEVLDVACGTGVLFPDYLARGVRVTGVDIAPEMVKAAKRKFPQVEVLCGDAETAAPDRMFDCIMIYNAFPHFPDPEAVIGALVKKLKKGGTLTVAHGASRAQIDAHHKGSASAVSRGLMHEDELEALFSKYLTVTVKISNDRMYQVTGRL